MPNQQWTLLEGNQNGKFVSACSNEQAKGCKCPQGFKGDGVHGCKGVPTRGGARKEQRLESQQQQRRGRGRSDSANSGGDSTSAATSSFHGVAIPPLRWPAAAAGGGTGRSWAAGSRRWAAAQLLVAQMGAKIALVGGGGTT